MNNLKKIRNQKGVSLRKLAQETGFNFSRLNRAERDIQPLKEKEIKPLCEYFNCTSDYLLGREPKAVKTEPKEDITKELEGLKKVNSDLIDVIRFWQDKCSKEKALKVEARIRTEILEANQKVLQDKLLELFNIIKDRGETIKELETTVKCLSNLLNKE